MMHDTSDPVASIEMQLMLDGNPALWVIGIGSEVKAREEVYLRDILCFQS